MSMNGLIKTILTSNKSHNAIAAFTNNINNRSRMDLEMLISRHDVLETIFLQNVPKSAIRELDCSVESVMNFMALQRFNPDFLQRGSMEEIGRFMAIAAHFGPIVISYLTYVQLTDKHTVDVLIDIVYNPVEALIRKTLDKVLNNK